ncbi:MAG: hypothetical protein NC226_07095 [Bacteroides cellulosilyticus]|nr:hypothetical protein [Bacteroides cellulosilyticus]
MVSSLSVCALFSALAAAGFSVLFGVESLRLRRRGCDSVLRRRYLRIVMTALFAGERLVPRFPMLRRRGARLLLAETLAGIVTMTYGLDVALLRRIVRRYRIDEWLLRRARYAQGYRRARCLALLAALPVGREVARRAARFGRSRNRYVRFYALLIRMTAEPAAALRCISGFPQPFSETEVAEITALLRRGLLPLAYEPLVASSSSNLRRVGLSIVRQFGIEQAEPFLWRMLAEEEGADALHALCALRRPLVRPEVVGFVSRLNPGERRTLMRYMARMGYSPRLLRRLFDPGECAYYETIVRSYKRCLV